MSDLWYWRSNDRVRGPLVTEELEAVVLNQRLADSDSVRLDGTDEWLPAAEIRRMFLQSSASPSETAAKLLETAAARRLKGAAGASGSTGLGGFFGKLTGTAGELVASLMDFVTRCFQACTAWLGRRGRVIVTAIAGVVVLVFLVTWAVMSLGPGDTTQLIEAEEIWKLIQANESTGFPLPAEVSQRMDKLEKELDASLNEQPVSGASGTDRRSSLARRELLYAVREMKESHAKLDDPIRTRIDQFLHAASNYVSGATDVSQDPAVAAAPQSRWSNEIIAVLVFDALLAVVVAGWWMMSRGRG